MSVTPLETSSLFHSIECDSAIYSSFTTHTLVYTHTNGESESVNLFVSQETQWKCHWHNLLLQLARHLFFLPSFVSLFVTFIARAIYCRHTVTRKKRNKLIDKVKTSGNFPLFFFFFFLSLLFFTSLYSTLSPINTQWRDVKHFTFCLPANVYSWERERVLLRERGRERERGIKVNWLLESTLHCCEEYSCLFAKYLT